MEIARYQDTVQRLRWDDLDLGAFTDDPLDVGSLRCLRYMHDVEHHTVCYLRDLLASPAHRDPTITTFLTLWAFEEHWHGEAFAAVLEAHGETAGASRVAAMRSRLVGRDRIVPLVHALAANLIGERFVGVHMTWGALNEWTTQAAYAQLARRAGHPVLGELLLRVMRQEGRHIDFYRAQAERRLASDGATRQVARTAIHRLWRPVGSGAMPRAETAHLARFLFTGPDGEAAVARIDRRVARLPGLDGLAPLGDAVAKLRLAA